MHYFIDNDNQIFSRPGEVEPHVAVEQEEYLQQIARARYFAYQLADFDGAEQAYRQVLVTKPNHIEALAGVGQALCRRHRLAVGRHYLLKAGKLMLRQAPKIEHTVLLQLAEQLRIWGEVDFALQLYRAAVKKSPQDPAALFGVAICLQRLNYVKLASAEFDKVLKLAPDDSGCQILKAILEAGNKQFSEAEQRLIKVLHREKDPGQLARACLELAKVLDQQKRYSEAYTLICRAGELQSGLPEVSEQDAQYVFKKIDLYQQSYDFSLLTRWRITDFQHVLTVPVFLMGFLRSGTTLIEQVLAAHPQVLTSDENFLLDEVIAQLELISGIKDNSPAALKNISTEQARHLRQFYWLRVKEEYGPTSLTKCFINKVALNSIEIGLISTLFPEAKIIYALRDPRDVCLSCSMQAFVTSVATINLLTWEGIARQYAAVMGLWLSMRECIATSYLELRYEDAVTDFENQFRNLFTYLGLEWRPEVSQYHKKLAGKFMATPSYSAVAQPLYQSSLTRWQGYRLYFESIQSLIQPYIQAFGYFS
jgi:tetratricopeptide (TPR) repeat protein